MSNLMPEKRLDKNGNLVTRHVKTGTTVPGAGRIPMPQAAPRDVAADRQLVVFASPKYRPTFMEAVKVAPQELVHQINDFYERHKPSGKITREVADQTIKIVEAAKIKSAPRYVELLSTHFEFISEGSGLGSDGISLVNGLIDIDDRVLRGMEPANEEQQRAIMKVTKAMVRENSTVDRLEDFELRIRHGMEHFVLSDNDLIKLVLDRPEDVDQIAEMVGRGVIRAGQIKAALDDNVQQPLLGGAL